VDDTTIIIEASTVDVVDEFNASLVDYSALSAEYANSKKKAEEKKKVAVVATTSSSQEPKANNSRGCYTRCCGGP
jgi:hypothetical protein